MSTTNASREDGSELFHGSSFVDQFQKELADQGGISLSEWVSEVPDPFQDSVVPVLLRSYVGYCKEHGLTLFVDEFRRSHPQFETILDQAINNNTPEGWKDEVNTIAHLPASTVYAVEGPWLQGGQGVLHQATDEGVAGRRVVLKFSKDEASAECLRTELEVTAKLEHPGVAAVFAQGTEESPSKRPFFSMRLIHGKSLDERISEVHKRIGDKQLSVAAAFDRARKEKDGVVSLVESIISTCHTVSYAHSVGVLHCDLKPKNIMCGRFGATVVLDWGSAQSYEIAAEQINDSTPLVTFPPNVNRGLTIAYASPEQLSRSKLTPASDVYSLGATLYHALTGEAPFHSDRRGDSPAPRARRAGSGVPKKLDAICAKAMAFEPEKRYAAVNDLQQDLADWLRDEKISAARDTFAEKVSRFVRRHQQASLIGLVAFLVATVLTFFMWDQRTRARQASRSLDSALDLIETLCEPLENDEINSLTEFNSRANLIHGFAENYIKENDHDAKRARAYEFSSMISFYHHNQENAGNNQTKSKQFLNDAIRTLEKSEAIYRDRRDEASLAVNAIRRARWQMKRLEIEEDSDHQTKQDIYQRLQEAIGLLKDRKDAESQSWLAEACHLKGEFFLSWRGAIAISENGDVAFGERLESDAVENNLALSHQFLTQEIEILENLRLVDPRKFTRELARGYGYRGDVFKTRGDHSQALNDYRASLRLRETLAQTEPSDENSFQLARGFVNFGILFSDIDDRAALNQLGDELQLDIASFPAGTPVEILICDLYVQSGLDQLSDLLNYHEDVRPREDFHWMCNVGADLCYFAATLADVSPEKKREYLLKAKDYAEAGGARYAQSSSAAKSELPRHVRESIANSSFLQLQIEQAGDAPNQQTVADLAQEFSSLLEIQKRGFVSLDDEALLKYCIVLHEEWLHANGGSPKNNRDLKNVIEEIQKRGLTQPDQIKRLIRMKKHVRTVCERPNADTLLTDFHRQIAE